MKFTICHFKERKFSDMISLGISLPKQLFLMIPRIYFVSATFIFNVRNNTPLILIWMSVHHQRLRTILHLQPSDKRWAKTNWCKLILISCDESASAANEGWLAAFAGVKKSSIALMQPQCVAIYMQSSRKIKSHLPIDPSCLRGLWRREEL